MADNNEWLARIRKQINPSHSAAADFWDSLQPEWRGVVLHAASVSGTVSLGSHLTKCSWSELYARVDSRGMAQIRLGIQQARNVFAGFGSLRRDDFVRRTANRQVKPCAPVKSGPEMVIAPHILQLIEQREQLHNKAGN
ncbi:hypothetical protein [Cronobacter sakazakii]|uniref:hypothetical protein n=1 Tax=Cronobacter sakazakii TaxID=28141 RepID=UPI00191360DC|nr:hypothetical protein [Cronobacter sakazakii]